jgi:ethanolamine utilization protein EutP (predicted NTPase)
VGFYPHVEGAVTKFDVTQRRSAEVSATQPRLTLTGFAKIFQSATDNFSLFSTELRNNQGVSCFVFR